MGPYVAIIKHVLSKSRDHRTWDGRRDHWETTKNYTAEYQGDAAGQWGPKWFQGSRTDYDAWSEGTQSGWTRDEIHWSNVCTNIHYSNSAGQSYTLDGFQDAFSNEDGVQAGVPDQDLCIEGWLGPEGSSGSRPVFVYHYYARGLRYHWDLSNADTEDAKVTARTEMKLYTGGRAGTNRQSLVRITACADEYLEPPNGAWGNTPILPMDPARIKVLGWWLFGHGLQDPGGPYVDPDEIARHEGYLYAALPDNSALGLNLRAPSAKHYNAMARVQKLRLNLRTVTFEGDNEPIPILQDSNGLPYPSPQCTNDDNGPLLGYPVLYPSGSYVQTFTGFKETGGGHFPLVVKGEVSGGLTSFTLWATNWPDDDCQQLVAWAYADKPLRPNTVDFYKPMTIKWYYGWTNKPKMMYAGYSTNWLYVSLKQPAGGNLLHTVVDVACRNAVGKATEPDIVAGIWRDFHRVVPGVQSWDRVEMKYWPEGWATPTNFTAECLVRDKEGRCGAWQDFYGAVLSVHSIYSGPLGVYPNPDIPAPAPPEGYTIRIGQLWIAFVASSGHPGQGNDQLPVNWYDLAKGNTTPGLPVDWADHGLTLYTTGTTNIIFDPSYGVSFASADSLDSAKAAWEQTSVVGFCWMWFNPTTMDIYRDFRNYDEVRNIIYPVGPLLRWSR
jgi:hypothetical protein